MVEPRRHHDSLILHSSCTQSKALSTLVRTPTMSPGSGFGADFQLKSSFNFSRFSMRGEENLQTSEVRRRKR